MTLLNKDQILKASDSKSIEIEVPEWGGNVRIQTMSGYARDRFEASIIGKNGGSNINNIRAKLVAACLVDDQGNLLFSESDIDKLGKKSSVALDRIFEAAQKLNGVGNTVVEELAKN